MEISVSLLPSGGYGYAFPTVRITPMNFLGVCQYMENYPKDDPLGSYLYDLKALQEDDQNIKECYIMDVDFLIFYKKLCTVSEDLSYKIQIKCPYCGKQVTKKVNFSEDIHFKKVDEKIMRGANIKLGGHDYETIVPTVNDFMKVFSLYLKYRKVTDIKMIKTMALIRNFDYQANQIEDDVMGATHSDITLLMALRDLYYDRLEPVMVECPNCRDDRGERREVAVSVDSLIVDFFRELYINSPIDASKIIFK